MNTKLSKESKNNFEKGLFKLLYNSVFENTMENVRKHGDVKLVTTNKRKGYLASKPNYHTTKWFSEDLLAMEMRKIKVKINTPVYYSL